MIIDARTAVNSLIPTNASVIENEKITVWESVETQPTEAEIDAEIIRLQADYDTNQPLKLLRAERDRKLKEEVDSKTCEAYNNGTQLSTDWKNYRQALLDMTLQTPTLDENGNLKAGLELDEIYWPTKPE
tara:strand:- start:148 stop:537 length:390 start_codon:yes stop_codon:yes gene_type:complete